VNNLELILFWICYVNNLELISEIRDWIFHYIDTTQSLELAAQQLVFAVPTLIRYIDEKEAQRFSRNVDLSELEFALS